MIRDNNVTILHNLLHQLKLAPIMDLMDFKSLNYNDEMMKLNNNNGYFTRVDFESDRLNHLSQIPH